MKSVAAVSRAEACLSRAPCKAHLAFSFETLTLYASPSAWWLFRLLSKPRFSRAVRFERGVFRSELESAGSEREGMSQVSRPGLGLHPHFWGGRGRTAQIPSLNPLKLAEDVETIFAWSGQLVGRLFPSLWVAERDFKSPQCQNAFDRLRERWWLLPRDIPVMSPVLQALGWIITDASLVGDQGTGFTWDYRSACECRPGNSEPRCSADHTVPNLIRTVVFGLKTAAVRILCF